VLRGLLIRLIRNRDAELRLRRVDEDLPVLLRRKSGIHRLESASDFDPTLH
jgi:hypothetical protein